MKFSISSASLASAVQTVTSIVSDRPVMAILGGVLIAAGDGEVTLRATDTSTSVATTISADVYEEGQAVVSAKMMKGIAKSLPEATVDFESSDDLMHLKCQKSKWALRTLDAVDFPAWDDFEAESEVALPRRTLADMVEKVYRVASKDDSQPVLKSVRIMVADNRVKLYATDGHRMIEASADCGDGEFFANVPSAALKGAMSIKSSADMVTIGYSGTQVRIDDGKFSYVTRLTVGNFPNMALLLPSDFSTTATMDAAELANALKRSDVVATINPSVIVTVDDDVLTIYASSPDQGESTEAIPIDLDGDSVTAGMNHNYLLDYVKQVDGEVELCMNGSMQQIVLKNYDEVDTTYLLMPVRI